MVRFLSLFSGIEAASAALKHLGWTCVGVAEIEPFPSAVLRHHYPDVPNLGDVTKVTQADIDKLGRIDVVVWGSPCQDLSIAGKRRGLDGERSGLFGVGWSIVQMARKNGCRFSLWENVPGAFSTNGGRDFMRVVATMGGLESFDPPRFGTEGVAVGPNGLVEWATLDAQWFGVAQKRRRVFALADFGDWSRRPPILLEPESLRGDSPPRREAGKKVAGTFTARTRSGGLSSDVDLAAGGCMIPEVSRSLMAGSVKMDPELETYISEVSATLSSSGPPFSRTWNAWAEENAYIAFPINTQVALRHKKLGERTGLGIGEDGDPSYTLGANHSHAVAHSPCTDPCFPLDLSLATKTEREHGFGVGNPGDPTTTLQTDGKLGVAYSEDVSPALKCNTGHTHREDGETYVVGFDCKASGAHGFSVGDLSPTLRSMSHTSSHQNGGGHSAVCDVSRLVVRRLTPLECARLQGFPDDYLHKVPWKKRETPPDGLMYRALGNSMAVPVIEWIGTKIMEAISYKESDES